MRSPGRDPPSPVWLHTSFASIQLEWVSAAKYKTAFGANDCLEDVSIVPEVSPTLSESPERAASAAGSKRARLISQKILLFGGQPHDDSYAVGFAQLCLDDRSNNPVCRKMALWLNFGPFSRF